MARLVLCVLALCAFGAYADPTNKVQKLEKDVLLQRQEDLMTLFYHIHEPIHFKKGKEIAKTWSLEENTSHFSNVTAVKTYVGMLKNKWYVPRAVPYAVNNAIHNFETVTVFNILYSAKDYETFYKTAVYLRDIVNEGLFVYVLSVAILYRPDTQGVVIPPIYEIFPSYFNNGEIMTTAQRINTHGHKYVEQFPSTYLWDNNVVIRWNATTWPYFDKNFPLTYFTHDYGLNSAYYYFNLMYPYWLGSHVVPGLAHERRGEYWWFMHKQILARYYMERLSNGFGEIPDLTTFVKDGYFSGLLYHNGIPYPSRPDNFQLDQPEFSTQVEAALEYERRIWEAIDKGFIVNSQGEHINILTNEGFDVLGNLIQANADSPNTHFYKDFLKLWKTILGNSYVKNYQYAHQFAPLVLPSALENYQTALRDPAFYVLWKRVMNLFEAWQKQMPRYTFEELSFPAVHIEKVETDKLVTYFDQTYMNVTSHLWMDDLETKEFDDHVSVVVQHPRLNHKTFNIKVHVKSDVAKTVVVKFFLAPKYDGQGFEIPLHLNTENIWQFDEFSYDLSVGESVITRESTAMDWLSKDWTSSFEIYEKVMQKKWMPDMSQSIAKFPSRLVLPKGRVSGMPFILITYIQEYRAPKVPFGTGFDRTVSLGLGSGAHWHLDEPMGFPINRPLYEYQVKGVKNMWFEDVLIYHKHTPEIVVPHTE